MAAGGDREAWESELNRHSNRVSILRPVYWRSWSHGARPHAGCVFTHGIASAMRNASHRRIANCANSCKALLACERRGMAPVEKDVHH